MVQAVEPGEFADADALDGGAGELVLFFFYGRL